MQTPQIQDKTRKSGTVKEQSIITNNQTKTAIAAFSSKLKAEVVEKLRLYSAALDKAEKENIESKTKLANQEIILNELQEKIQSQSQQINFLRAELEKKAIENKAFAEQLKTKEKSNTRTNELDCRLLERSVWARKDAEDELHQQAQIYNEKLAKANLEFKNRIREYINTITKLKTAATEKDIRLEERKKRTAELEKKFEQHTKSHALNYKKLKTEALGKINLQAEMLKKAKSETTMALEEIKRLSKAKARTDEFNERLIEKCKEIGTESGTEQICWSD